MRCNRCGAYVPPWLWIGDDHPVIIDQRPATLTRDDNPEDNTFKITMETRVQVGMCSDIVVSKNTDFIDIGPECFADKDALVISYKGENYYKACGHKVKGRLDGDTTTCVKRVNHKNDCEDYDGDTRPQPAGSGRSGSFSKMTFMEI